MRYAAPYLSDTAEAVIKLNTAIKAAALQFEKLPKDPPAAPTPTHHQCHRHLERHKPR